jgi:chromosome segregation ATPase
VIEAVLFFALGFLSAGFLLLLAAPAFARRARRLERRSLEATLPMSMNELMAEKDRVRADAAVKIRKSEIELKAARDKTAEHAILVGRAREDARLLKEESARRQTAINALEAERDRLRQALAEAQEALRAKAEQAAELDEKANALQRERDEAQKERDEVSRLYEEASFSASSRQIEMVGRESDIDRLGEDVQTRNREIDRLKRERDEAREQRVLIEEELVGARAERVRLEAELSEASRASGLFTGLRDGEQADALAKLTAERDRLETRTAALMRENKKLREEVQAAQAAAAAAAAAPPATPPSPEDLRGQMAELAAQVTALAAKLEGADGAIDRILAATPAAGDGGPPSLADRIRALRERAS